MNFVVSFVEVIKLLKLVISMLFNAYDLLHVHLCFDHAVRITLVEWQHLFFFSLKLTAKLSRLQDFLTKILILGKSLHALERVTGEHTDVLFFLVALFRHVLLQLLVMVIDFHLLSVQLAVPLGELAIVLLDFQLPVDFGVAESFNRSGGVRNFR